MAAWKVKACLNEIYGETEGGKNLKKIYNIAPTFLNIFVPKRFYGSTDVFFFRSGCFIVSLMSDYRKNVKDKNLKKLLKLT